MLLICSSEKPPRAKTSNAIKPNPIAARGAMEMDLKFMVAVLKDLRDD
jgi:hypothetical protein